MAEIIDDNFMVCTECMMVIANCDYTILDDLPEEEAAKRKEAIDDGLANAGGWICPGDSEKDDEFSWHWCDCCHTSLGGSRHHCILMEIRREQNR